MREDRRYIPGYGNRYLVSNCGIVMNMYGHILRPGITIEGYMFVGLSKNGKRKMHKVHKLVASLFIGPRPAGLDVCHNDGDKFNNSVSNLRYDTKSNNNLDTVKHGRNKNFNKTHCPNGHEYSEANTHLYRNRRYCKTCRRINVTFRRIKQIGIGT